MILQEFHQPQEVSHKLKLPSKLMPMVLWMLKPQILVQVKQKMLSSQMKKEDFLKKKLSKCSKMLKLSQNKIEKPKNKLTQKTPLKVIFIQWEIQSKTQKSLKTNSILMTLKWLKKPYKMLRIGWLLMEMLLKKNLKISIKN